MFEYAASIISVHDGDTCHADVDLGCDIHVTLTLRFFGINAPELATKEGKAALDHLLELLGPLPAAVTVHTVKDHKEKYGRYLASLILPDGTNVNDRMVADGFAVVYSGGPR